MTGFSEISPESRPAPRPVRLSRGTLVILFSWGLAVLLLAGLLSFWIDYNRRQSDRDMCALVGVLAGGPAPVDGPTGQRAREIQSAMREWSEQRHCAS